MLTIITVFTCLVFSSLYLLCFWLVREHPIDTSFRKFNIMMANLIGGVGLVILLLMHIPLSVKIMALLWKGTLLSVSSFLWKKEKINAPLMTLPSILGIATLVQFQAQFTPVSWDAVFVLLLGGAVFCLSLFSMILGHWYLNVHGLPISYLMRSTYVFWSFLVVRFVWDLYALMTQKIIHSGDTIYLYEFIGRSDGFLLSIALFFGTLLPVILIYFVKETLRVKSTQSATGLLYVIVIAVLMGDLAYKYYLFRFGLAL